MPNSPAHHSSGHQRECTASHCHVTILMGDGASGARAHVRSLTLYQGPQGAELRLSHQWQCDMDFGTSQMGLELYLCAC